MARLRILDNLQVFRFWLIDIYPSLNSPFFVLGGAFAGYASITMPELTAEMQEIKQENVFFPHQEYLGGSYSNVVLTRGSKFYDSSFNEWIQNAINGSDVTRRNFLLIHYTGVSLADVEGAGIPVPGNAEVIYAPGKVWVLGNCLPVRYKPTSDFDAKTGDVAIMELEMALHSLDEISLSQSEIGAMIEMVIEDDGK